MSAYKDEESWSAYFTADYTPEICGKTGLWRGLAVANDETAFLKPLNGSDGVNVRVLPRNVAQRYKSLSEGFDAVRAAVIRTADSLGETAKAQGRSYGNELAAAEVTGMGPLLNGSSPGKQQARQAYDLILGRMDAIQKAGWSEIFLRATSGARNESTGVLVFHRDAQELREGDTETLRQRIRKGYWVERFQREPSSSGDAFARTDSTCILDPAQVRWNPEKNLHLIAPDPSETGLRIFSPPLGDSVHFAGYVYKKTQEGAFRLLNKPDEPATFHSAPHETHGLFLQADPS